MSLLSVQVLAEDLGGDARTDIKPNQKYELWSPDSAFPAADVLLHALFGIFGIFPISKN